MAKLQPDDSTHASHLDSSNAFMRLPYGEVNDTTDLAIVGIPSGTGSTYMDGARFAPRAIREASLSLGPYNQAHDVQIFEHCSGVDFGEAPVVPDDIEDAFHAIVKYASSPLLENDITPIFLGGDHAITLAELRAVAIQYGPAGLLQLDAHNDTMRE